MAIIANPATFDSLFTLYYLLTFETAAGQTCRPPIKGNCQFGQNGAQWNTAAALFAFLVKGPDNCTPATPPTTGHCLGTKDQNANKHTSRPQGTVDFYVVGTALHVTGGGQHAVVAACQTGRSCSQGQVGGPAQVESSVPRPQSRSAEFYSRIGYNSTIIGVYYPHQHSKPGSALAAGVRGGTS